MKFPKQKAGWVGVVIYAIFGGLPVLYGFLVINFNFPDIVVYFISGDMPQILYFYPLVFSPGYRLATLLPDLIPSELAYYVVIFLINFIFFYWFGVLVKKIFTKSPTELTQN